MATLKVDYENNAEEWWKAFSTTNIPDEISPYILALQRDVRPDEIEVPDSLVEPIFDWLSSLPGWDADPRCAPLFVTD